MRTFPISPRSVADLEVGDFWVVDLPGGGVGVMQVRDLSRSGPGARTAFVAGVVEWRGIEPPQPADLQGRRVIAQGLIRIETFTDGGAVILGNVTDTVPDTGLTSSFQDHGVGTKTEVWGWKALGRRAESALGGD